MKNEDNKKRFPLYHKVKHFEDARTYVRCQNQAMKALGFTEHGLAHVGIVAERSRYILETLGDDDRTHDRRIDREVIRIIPRLR